MTFKAGLLFSNRSTNKSDKSFAPLFKSKKYKLSLSSGNLRQRNSDLTKRLAALRLNFSN